MPRVQYSYDYPEVHPPHPQAQHRKESQETSSQSSNRYSWMDAPNDNSGPTKRNSTAPPLPIVPEYLNNNHQSQQSVPRIQPPPQPQPQSQQHHHHHQHLSKQQEAAMYQQPNQKPQQNDYTHMYQQQQLQPDNTYIQPPQQPDPVKRTPDHPNYRSTIVPDENPLSPVSPVDKKTSPQRQTTNMSVVAPTSSNYNFTNYAPAPQIKTGGSWTHTLCSCSEPTICMTGLFCPCIVYGRTQHRLHLKTDKKDPTNMLGYSTVNGSCLAWAFLCGFNGILSGVQKSRVRRAYEMESGSGNCFSDCLVGCCCCCCVLAQNEKEVKLREESGRRSNGQEGYVPPGGMVFAPPPR